MGASTLEAALLEQFYLLRQIERLPEPEREHRFHPERRWRFDLAWPRRRVAAEVEGGVWVRGRHTRGAGFERDAEKYNAAALLGWCVLRFTRRQIESGAAIDAIREALTRRGKR